MPLESSPPSTQSEPEPRPRALVVDDDAAFRITAQTLLAERGFHVCVEGTLAGARARATAERFDLFVVDKNLGSETGLDLARELRGGDCAVMLMSAYATLPSALEALNHGVADYLVKPFSHQDFLARVDHAMEHLRLRRANDRLVAELRRRNEELEGLATRDSLTHLFNHGYFQDALAREISRSQRRDQQVSVVLIDLDNFKHVNDSRGHLAGDEVLRRIAGLIGGLPGEAGAPRSRTEDIAARYGGDEFALILPETGKTGAAARAERLRQFVESERLAGSDTQSVTLSMGVATFPEDGADASELLKRADDALYAAKRHGRNRLVAASPELSRHGEASRSWSDRFAALKQSLAEELFTFHFQPIVRAENRAVFAYEGLCRPTHPLFSSPPELIESAELAGMVTELGRALRAACAQKLANAPADCLIFVNLHPLELFDPQLGIQEPHLRSFASRLVFEVTETHQLTDYDRVRAVIERLRSHGFRVALDDVGAGYSGLHTLTMLNPDFVKLDRSLVQEIHERARTHRLVRHIHEFAREEGMTVIAEGVETQKEAQALRSLGVELMQGYHFCRPAPPFPLVPPEGDPSRSG